MIKKKILIVSPYPIIKIEHGGQKRAQAFFDYYKKIFEEAKYVAVFHRGQYPDWGEDDMPLGDPELIKKIDKNPYASELVSGQAIDNDIHVRSRMAQLLMQYRPDVIHIEQPYPYLGLRVLLRELDMHPKIIFGSQNIEYSMKERIYKGLKIPAELWKSSIDETKRLEILLSEEANLVFAVNSQDAEAHKLMGATKCIVVPNGINKSTPSKKSVDYWKKFKRDNSIEQMAVFVGSGHPPNWLGFLNMVGEDTVFMPENSKIVVAGGTADYLRSNYSGNKKFLSGVVLVGKLEEDKLAGLLSLSDVILLPIGTGGGSNLKTAEAILSGKKIVATPRAFHGFEKYKSLPNIWVENSREGYRQAIISALAADYKRPKRKYVRLAQSVQWDYYMKPLKKYINTMIYGSITRRYLRRAKHGAVRIRRLPRR